MRLGRVTTVARNATEAAVVAHSADTGYTTDWQVLGGLGSGDRLTHGHHTRRKGRRSRAVDVLCWVRRDLEQTAVGAVEYTTTIEARAMRRRVGEQRARPARLLYRMHQHLPQLPRHVLPYRQLTQCNHSRH